MDELELARKEINEADREMAKLFEKRMNAVKSVAAYKKEHALSISDPVRENEVIAKNSALIENDVIREYYIEFLKNNMKLSREYQSRLNEGMKVAYSGVEGAFGYIAAMRMYPEAKLISYRTFEEAYDSVCQGECDCAVLPIENSYAGDVGNVMDLIFSGSLYVNQVIDLPVTHNLIANEGATLDTVKTVISHPQALAQCSEYIKSHGFEEESYPNTAASAKHVKETGRVDVAAIASIETAQIYGLNVLQENINSSRMNTTRFAAFSRSQSKPSGTAKKMNEHFILVFTVKNEAGALAKTLDIIGAHGYNMRNLRSRPMKELLWSYYFYIEAEGSINTQDGKDMLRELGATCDRLKLAGTYYTSGLKR